MRHLFFDDYSEGAHPAILAAITAANEAQEIGYGEDSHSRTAAARISDEFGGGVEVHLLSGGTQANIVCLASMLRHHEAVVAAETGHIHVHETGAIEAAGHKIISLPTPDGKLTPSLLDTALAAHQDEHSVRPRVVFISQATETGSVYSADELATLVRHAHAASLLVYMDGARLAMALVAESQTLGEIKASGVDMMYLGGTKNGGLFGEAVVILNADLTKEFRYHMKQRGALLAKGRGIGAQFARFFDTDHLWYRLGQEANAHAARLADGLESLGVPLMQRREANQVFAILPMSTADALRQDYGFHVWKSLDDGRVVVRLVCSWATPDTEVAGFLARVKELD